MKNYELKLLLYISDYCHITFTGTGIPLYGLVATIIVISLLLIISVIINIGQFIKSQKKNTVNVCYNTEKKTIQYFVSVYI